MVGLLDNQYQRNVVDMMEMLKRVDLLQGRECEEVRKTFIPDKSSSNWQSHELLTYSMAQRFGQEGSTERLFYGAIVCQNVCSHTCEIVDDFFVIEKLCQLHHFAIVNSFFLKASLSWHPQLEE